METAKRVRQRMSAVFDQREGPVNLRNDEVAAAIDAAPSGACGGLKTLDQVPLVVQKVTLLQRRRAFFEIGTSGLSTSHRTFSDSPAGTLCWHSARRQMTR